LAVNTPLVYTLDLEQDEVLSLKSIGYDLGIMANRSSLAESADIS